MFSRTLLCIVGLFAICSSYAFAETVAADSFASYAESIEEHDVDLSNFDLEESLSSILLQSKHLTSLDLSNPRDKEIYDAFLNDEEFLRSRDNKYMIQYGLTAQQYDSKFHSARQELLEIAKSADVTVDISKNSYTEVLDMLYSQANSSNYANSAKSASINKSLARVYGNVDYFDSSNTLDDPLVVDMLGSVQATADKFVNWLIKNINTHKCTWCKNVANHIRKKACGVAGDFMCRAASKLAGVFQLVVENYVCGKPLNVAGIFSNWCQAGVKYAQGKTGLTDAKLCHFHIPTFTVLKNSVAIGYVC